MRIQTEVLGVALGRDERVYLEYAMFAALRQFLPRIGHVFVCLRRSHTGFGGQVSCVATAALLPAGRAVAACRMPVPRAAIDSAARELGRRVAEAVGRPDTLPPESLRVRPVPGPR